MTPPILSIQYISPSGNRKIVRRGVCTQERHFVDIFLSSGKAMATAAREFCMLGVMRACIRRLWSGNGNGDAGGERCYNLC